MNQNNSYRDALARIADLARDAIQDDDDFADRDDSRDQDSDYTDSDHTAPDDEPGCIVKSVPKRLLVKAAQHAKKINPMNAPVFGPVATVGDGLDLSEPLKIAVLVSKYWGPTARRLTVSFMESTPADLKARIITHMNAWSRTGCISFAATSGPGDVRISRGPGGYWSYLGTDIKLIPRNRQTMNLQGFTMSTPESEYKRVVRHETGHTLGFPHEHMRRSLVARIDPQKAYRWFLQTYGWDKATVDAQVLTPLNEASLMGTPADQDSIMCYQLPGLITKDAQPIRGGTDIDSNDYGFCGRIYPKAHHALSQSQEEDWSEAEDVEVGV